MGGTPTADSASTEMSAEGVVDDVHPATLSSTTHDVAGRVIDRLNHPEIPQPSVAELLSRLQNSPAIQGLTSTSHVVQDPPVRHGVTNRSVPLSDTVTVTDPRVERGIAPPAVPQQDLRGFSFQQALPVIAQLSENIDFVQSIQKVRLITTLPDYFCIDSILSS